MGKGGFGPDHPKMGGRAKGTRNKNTVLKENMRNFVMENYDGFVEAFNKLGPKDKCAVYLKASEFVMPKISSIQFEDPKDSNSGLELLRIRASYKQGK